MENTLPNRFKNRIAPFKLDLTQPYVVAVSGGLDSVVLCRFMLSVRHSIYPLRIVNFGLRGEESNRDEAFVKSLGNKYGVEVLVQAF